MNKKDKLINTVNEFSEKYFNKDQKSIIINILEMSPEEQAQEYFDFLIMKKRIGFYFDSSPEIAQGRLINLNELKSLNINIDNKKVNENKLMIGDNFNSLKALNITHKNKIDIIYIDPPYNTDSAKSDGNDSAKEDNQSNKFIYKDKFGRTGWLNMMADRLKMSKDLLTDKGVIFVSIDDNEQAYLKVLMDQIFGLENFVANIIWNKTSQGATMGRGFKRTHEHILVYSMDPNFSPVPQEVDLDVSKYKYEDEKGKYAVTNALNSINSFLEQNKKRGYTIYWNEKTNDAILKMEYDIDTLIYDEKFDDGLIEKGYIPIRPGLRNGKQTCWNWTEERFMQDYKSEILFKTQKDGTIFPFHKNRFTGGQNPFTIQTFDSRSMGNKLLNSIFMEKVFDYPKPIDLIMWLIKRVPNNENALILDYFAGSGTTGHSVLELNRNDNGNRKFILCTNNENSIAMNVTYERLHRIIKGETSTGESNFDWINKNEKYDGNSLRVIELTDDEKIGINEQFDTALLNEKVEQLKLLDSNYSNTGLKLYYDLAALNPLEKTDESN